MNHASALRIGLIGYGKMGKEIESVANDYQISIGAIIDAHVEGKQRHITAESLRDVDVCIEFTEPSSVLANIEAIASTGRDLVVGTTGWYDKIDAVRQIVEKHNIGCVYASNYSIGMKLFERIVRRAGELFASQSMYDCFLHETHHAKKKDSPSGTALTLANALLSVLPEKKNIVSGEVHGEKPSDILHIASSRGGAIPGTHTVTFDSMADTIELTHRARSRRGFAEGALVAARWVHGKKGLFTMENMLDEQSI